MFFLSSHLDPIGDQNDAQCLSTFVNIINIFGISGISGIIATKVLPTYGTLPIDLDPDQFVDDVYICMYTYV